MTPRRDDIDAAILRYRSAELAPSGESNDKIEAVHDLERYLGHPTAAAFLASILRDPDEYDLARVEVCKALRASPPSTVGLGLADALLEALQPESDVLVRQWAASALRTFHHLPTVVAVLADRVADAHEDRDVRHNAVASLDGAPMDPAVRAALATRLSDSDLGGAIRRVLTDE